MAKHTISAVIICYNHEKYIGACIQSILNQTRVPDEIVIVDDHSPDGSCEVIAKYAKAYPGRIRAYRQKQNQMIRNSYYAKNQAGGDYVTFIDGDDLWMPNKIKAEYEALMASPDADVAYSNVVTIDSDGNPTGIWYDGNGGQPPSGKILKQVFSKQIFPKNASVFRHYMQSKRSLAEDDYIDPGIPIHIDWDLKIRLAASYKIVFSGEANTVYRIHTKGMHNKQAQARAESIKYVYDKNRVLLSLLPPGEAVLVKNRIQELINQMHPEGEYRLALPTPAEIATQTDDDGRVMTAKIGLPQDIKGPGNDEYFEQIN